MPYWYFLCWVGEDDQAISKTLQAEFWFYLRFSVCGCGIISNFCSHKQDWKAPTICIRKVFDDVYLLHYNIRFLLVYWMEL